MPLASFEALFSAADSRRPMTPMAAAGGADATVLQALRIACDRGWVAPRVVGGEAEVRRGARDAAGALGGFTVVEAAEAAGAAVALVRSGQARLLMKGQISTPALLKAMLDPATGLRTDRVICQVVLMELAHTDRRFLLADSGICIQPTLAQKSDILHSVVALARALGAPCPRVASLAATEAITPALPETLEAAELEPRQRAGEL